MTATARKLPRGTEAHSEHRKRRRILKSLVIFLSSFESRLLKSNDLGK